MPRPAAGALASATPAALRERRYQEVLREHGRGLARVAASHARSASEREDLLQEIALSLWRALPRFREEASLRTFAYRVARNCAIDHLRKRRTIVAAGELVDQRPRAEDVLDRRGDRQRLLDAIQALPLSQRHVLTLQLEGLSYAEIAEVIGITEKNVSARLSRARKTLRERLGGTR